MSIVATMMFPNGGVLMYGDKRAVTNINNSITIADNYVKVHKVNEKIACGITGYGEWGLLIVDKLKNSHFNNIAAMFEYVKLFPYPLTDEILGSTITLAGVYDDERPFLWTYRTSGETTFVQDDINYSVATNPLELGNACSTYLVKRFQETSNPHETLQSVIKFASKQSPYYISDSYDMVVIPFKL